VGGDTTFTIIAEEILKHPSPPVMGMIGTGSANDVVRGLGIHRVTDACTAIMRGHTRDMDVGEIKIKKNGEEETSIFLGTVSAGLGSSVNRYVELYGQRHRRQEKLNPLHQLTAGVMGISSSFSKKQLPLRVELEYPDPANGQIEKKEIEFSLLVFLNTPFYAGGLRMVPPSSFAGKGIDTAMGDGLVDCCIADTHTFGSTFELGIKVLLGTHFKNHDNKLKWIRSPYFKVSSVSPFDIQVDGTIIEQVEKIDISLLPLKLRVLAPLRVDLS